MARLRFVQAARRGVYKMNALESLLESIVFSPLDWSANSYDAWVYGIVAGWSPEAMRDVADNYGWRPEKVAILRQYHREFARRITSDSRKKTIRKKKLQGEPK